MVLEDVTLPLIQESWNNCNRRASWVQQRSRDPAGKKGFAARKITWDHRPKQEKSSPYDYESAGQLLEGFWREAERIMGEK